MTTTPRISGATTKGTPKKRAYHKPPAMNRTPERTPTAPKNSVTAFMAANGEVEGPDDHAGQAPRAHTVFQRPRRQTADASRPPPTIVRSHFETPVGVSERPTEVSA